MVRRRLSSLWPDISGQTVLGYGYTHPYLAPYYAQSRRTVLAMPEGQGVSSQDEVKKVLKCLVAEDNLPFPDASFDRIGVAHGLEETPDLGRLLSELWRVTQPEGRIVVLAANRAGLWAGSEKSPFGAGRPFSRTQLRGALHTAGFMPTFWSGALYAPPVPRLAKASFATACERFGETVWPGFSGLILVEAIKRLYATPEGLKMSRAKPAPFKTATVGTASRIKRKQNGT